MLKLENSIEPVSFMESENTPEITGYNDSIPVEIKCYDEYKPETTTTIKIGNEEFLPGQLRNLLNDCSDFIGAQKTINKFRELRERSTPPVMKGEM